jgi:hypothetical protein
MSLCLTSALSALRYLFTVLPIALSIRRSFVKGIVDSCDSSIVI